MTEIILLAVLILSLGGIGVILCRKIPVLVKLPETSVELNQPFTLIIKKGVKALPGLKTFSYELYLQKILSRVRVLTLKTESKTGSWLERLRQKSNHKNDFKNDSYWDELKKAKDGK